MGADTALESNMLNPRKEQGLGWIYTDNDDKEA